MSLEGPKTDCEMVLDILRAWKGDWVPNLYRMTGVMVHSRVAELRKRGHDIECRHIKGKGYCYRLVEAVTAEA